MSGRIVIVGAGPGGLTLALLLVRARVPVTVFERAATFEREFRGDSLLPSGLRILEDLGLRDRLRGLERASPTAVRLYLGRRRDTFDSAALRLPDGEPVVTSIPQRALLEAIAAEAATYADFNLRMGVAVRELIAAGTRVTGVRHTGGETQADAVIGFDGRFSTVRRTAGIGLEASRVDYDIAWCALPMVPGAADRYEATIRGEEVCFWYPSGSMLRVGWLLRKGTYESLRAAGFERFKQRVLDAVTDGVRPAADWALRSWHDVTLLPAVSDMAQRWWRPGVLLLGDAAHPMSPVGAQGINVALQDAVVAAQHLVPAPASPDETLAAIEAERRPAVGRIARLQNFLPRAMLTLGPERALRLAVAVLRPFVRGRFRPAFARALVDRFVWGDPPVRVRESYTQEVVAERHPA